MLGGLVFSWDMFLNILLLADWHTILACREQLVNNALLCAKKRVSILTTRLVNRFSNIREQFKNNLSKRLHDPLTFLVFTLMALWQLVCCLVLPNVSMFPVPCHIRSPHLCNLTWNSWLFLVDYGVGECYAKLCLLQDSQESCCVDFHSSFYGYLWHHVHMPCMCPLILLLFCPCVCWMHCCVLSTLS